MPWAEFCALNWWDVASCCCVTQVANIKASGCFQACSEWAGKIVESQIFLDFDLCIMMHCRGGPAFRHVHLLPGFTTNNSPISSGCFGSLFEEKGWTPTLKLPTPNALPSNCFCWERPRGLVASSCCRQGRVTWMRMLTLKIYENCLFWNSEVVGSVMGIISKLLWSRIWEWVQRMQSR